LWRRSEKASYDLLLLFDVLLVLGVPSTMGESNPDFFK
jgi:hypothetical protein